MAHVLVVDDDPDIRMLLDLVLRLEGHSVTTASGGEPALEVLRGGDLSCRVPVVVLDVQMPDLDGWQVLEAMRADDALRDVPVMMCTVRASAADLARGWAAGCDAYQSKPFDLATISAEISALAAASPEELWRLRRERAQLHLH
jgi:CheY-like chemotaxis protein